MQNLAQMLFANDHDVIKAFSSDRADQTFAMSILPRRAWNARLVTYAHSAQTSFEYVAIDAVPVANEICRRLFPAASFSELAGDPFCGRMCGNAYPQHFPAVVPHNQQAIEQSKGEGWNDEQIHCRDAIGMISQKGSPSL